MRVLHVIDHLGVGGAQVLLANLCTWTGSAAYGLRHEVLVLHGAGRHAELLRAAGVPVRSLATARGALPAILLRLAAHIRRPDYDLLHLHLEASTLLGSALAALRGRRPALATIYSLKEQYRRYSWPPFELFALTAPWVSTYISLWENTDLASIGVPPQKISVIPIGVDFSGADPSRSPAVRAALCKQYGIASERPLLLSVARLHPNRHIHLLVEAMAPIVAARPDALLLMVGDGEERPRLEQIIARHGIERNVLFAGTRSDIWELLPGCDVYMSSSGRCDTGVAAIQAMACARPVVTYTIAALDAPRVECTCQGVFVQTRDPAAMAEATLDLLADATAAANLGRRARAQVLDQFSLDQMMLRYVAAYRRPK